MPVLTERTWLYRGQTGRIFSEGDAIPDGWGFAPEVPYAAEGEWPSVVELKHTPEVVKNEDPGQVEVEVRGFGGGLQKASDVPVRRGPGRPPKVQE